MTDDGDPGVGLTRRRWLDRTAAATGGLGAVGLASAGSKRTTASGRAEADEDEANEATTTDLPLADVHTHLLPMEALGREPVTSDELVAWMDDGGIDVAVLLALDSPESYPVQSPSWWVLERAAEYPERLVPFCTVDPRALVHGRDTVESVFADYVDAGARGVGELKPGLAIDDERVEAVYELAAEHELPILFHTDETAMVDDVGLPGIEDVLASFPEVDFIAHAGGWWAHVSADVTEADVSSPPDRPVEPGGRVPELLGAYDNVYGDISGPSGWAALDRDPEYAASFLSEHAEQLAFGTDYFYRGQRVPQLELFERFDLDREAWAAIRYRNLRDLLE